MRKLITVSLGVLLIASIGCGGSGKSSASNVDLANVDAKKLNLTLTDVNDQEHNMRRNLGKVVILDFWDTWCGPCRKEIPHFIELYDEYKDQGFEMVGVAFARNGKDAVKKFTEQNKINYLSTIGNDQAYAIFGRPRSIPTTYIIDKNGEIAETVVGYRPKEFFESKIKALLAAS